MSEIFVNEKAVLVRIKDNIINADELYNRTRKAWRVSLKRANKAEYALSIHDGIVKEVYKINFWQLAEGREPRCEFYGEIAENDIRNKYLGASLKHYFKFGSANPIRYINI